LKLNKRFGNGAPQSAPAQKTQPKPQGPEPLVNEPLNFRLKDLDSAHPYLAKRGFSREVMDFFGVGFCSNGVFAGRIAIPLHDSKANLVGYAGRVIDDKTISAQNPKYLFPGKREEAGELVEFRKSLFLYNWHRFNPTVRDLIIVEGFPAVWWLKQHGFSEAVALMGSTASDRQIELILQISHPCGRIWIIADGDKAGRKCAEQLSVALSPHRLCRVICEEGRQPTDYSGEELKDKLGTGHIP
jgi:DNA primase